MAGGASYGDWRLHYAPGADKGNPPPDSPETRKAYVDWMNSQGGNASIDANGNIDDGAPKTAGFLGDLMRYGAIGAGTLIGGPVLGGAIAAGSSDAYSKPVDKPAPGVTPGPQNVYHSTGAGGVNSGPGTGTTPNPGAWASTPSAGYGNTYESDATKAERNRLAIVQKELSDPNLDPTRRDQLTALAAHWQQRIDASIQADKSDPNRDTKALGQNATNAGNRAAPTLDRTKIDYSGAVPYENRQNTTGDLMLQQADALQSGRSGAGQQALVGRLNNDLNGGQPSLAENQLLEGRDVAMRNSLAIANSARGNSMPMAQLAALRANQTSMQQTNRQAAELRAQEYATARGELGSVLNQQRTGGIQEQSIAATELGHSRDADISALKAKYDQAVQQGLISAADARTQFDGELRQRGMNDAEVNYYTTQYFNQQNRGQDISIDAEKTRVNTALGVGSQSLTARGQDMSQGQFDANRTDKYVGAALNTGGAVGQQYINSGNSGNGNTNTGPTYVNDTGHSNAGPDTSGSDPGAIKDPWADSEA